MEIRQDFVDSIGNTPLIRLRKASELTGCTILGKAEFLNPGGSVKDRAARAIILDAEKKGLIQPGGLIVEGTAGNTGIGLALVGNARGYRTLIVIPETQSEEKKDQSRRIAEETAATESSGAIWANQFDNTVNRMGHYETTGPEIWEQTDGTVDAFICSVGTGGTLAGIAMALRERNPDIVIGLVDPMGAALYSYYTTGKLQSVGSSITEGIGQGRITANLEGLKVDAAFRVTDDEMLPICFELLRDEALCLGGSAALNVAGAIRLAKQLGPGKTIVTVLCDSGVRYKSKLFNPEFLRSKDLPVPIWLENGE